MSQNIEKCMYPGSWQRTFKKKSPGICLVFKLVGDLRVGKKNLKNYRIALVLVTKILNKKIIHLDVDSSFQP